MSEVHVIPSKRRAPHSEAVDTAAASDASGAKKRRAFLQTMGQQLREFGAEGTSPQDDNRSTFRISPANNAGPPSIIENAAGVHSSVRPVDTPESDAAPGEEDQLPAGASKSASRWLWRQGEVVAPTPETIASPIIFEDLLEWSQAYFDHWHPAFPFLHAPSLLDYFRQIVQRGTRVAALSTANELQHIVLRSVMSISICDRRQIDTARKAVPTNLVFHSINDAIRSTQLILTEETSVLKRLFWSVLCIDRHICIRLGTPLGIRSDEANVCYPHTERHHDREDRDGKERDDRLDLLEFLAQHADIRGSIMQTRHRTFLHGSANETEEALEREAEHTRWWNMVDEYLSNEEQVQNISKAHQVTLIVLRFESILALHRSVLAISKKDAAYNVALQRCISASRSIINTLHKALRGFGAFDGSPGQHGYERTPLIWPSFTWAVWMSTFVILSAASEGQVTRDIAIRLSDRSIQILKHLALRGTKWPDACIVAIQNLTARLSKPSTRSSTVVPGAAPVNESRPTGETSSLLAANNPTYDYIADPGNFLGIAHQDSDNPLPNEQIMHLFNGEDMNYWWDRDFGPPGNMAYHNGGFR
ncbi:hypothetical protein COCC4DRAFT_202411 [Bipolaris maydis ATCC 48331]|uniref:Xylanolytic transcriptional activator regulatory domain-containing protein n=2 Tax=Cochliobolus heterostrophus TaxID=5016 RepID=M2U206_COCH5|nr:uncharacterized protein COCC4DRAFT_202411 [Bipolaris maydis ATCC 48331]EMD88076.1 hypothetical protein COCHEDRAFT_1183347 [Bipolaris maydis C5]ENI02340.1 hypothetical protein COCC4DRAFT_202411 [Bipolaris maydis ATCC 48331]KAJ6207047.1 hypothetical protein PSV09DRAFT_1183347 [Bipolaris maydis]